MMALYHCMYDLETFGGYKINAVGGFWRHFADATASAFLLLVGVSLAISFSRASEKSPDQELFGKYLKRGLRILGYAMILTVVSWALHTGWILFGILHLIGVSIILAYPFLRYRLPTLIAGVLVILVGAYIQIHHFSSGNPWLLPFGIEPHFFMADYRPLLPWFGVVLLGLFVGNIIYGSGKKGARGVKPAPRAARPLAFMGRHSLLIYFVHQPVMIAILVAFGVINLWAL